MLKSMRGGILRKLDRQAVECGKRGWVKNLASCTMTSDGVAWESML